MKFQIPKTMQYRYVLVISYFVALSLQAQVVEPASAQRANTVRRSGLPESHRSVTLPLKVNFYGYFVEAQINGKPVELLLDTGASRTTLSHESAKRIGLNVSKREGEEVTDPTGKIVKVKHAVTNRIDLGEAWTKNEKVWISAFPPGYADGVLGISTLADWDVRIDPRAKSLTFFSSGQADALKGETVVPLTTKGLHNLWVSVRIGDHPVTAKPDTGSMGTLQLPSILVNRLLPEAMKKSLPSLDAGIALSGKVVSRSVKIPELTFGPDTLEGLPVDVVESDDSVRLIGLEVLRHYVLTFRFSVGELRLNPLGTVQDLTKSSTAGLNMLYDDAGRIIIQSVVPNGPADKVGLQAGDELMEIEGKSLKTMKPDEFASFKQLPPGAAVNLRYRRGNSGPSSIKLVLTKE
jgi:predicted aspartyl protease